MLKDGAVLNKKSEGSDLYEIRFTQKGSTSRISVFVYADSRLDAANFMILNHFFGKQHSITSCTSNLLK